MRILIQHAIDRSYFDGRGWKAGEAHAAGFESVLQAEHFCQTQKLVNALVVLKFRQGEEMSYRAGVGAPLLSRPSASGTRLCA